jgi:hypothetical protein
MRSAPEQRLQRAVAEYLAWALDPPAWFSAFPAGGGGQMRGLILKGLGLKAGVPDILIVHRGRAWWIELKSVKGSVSAVQNSVHGALSDAGCDVKVCRTLDDVRASLALWGIPTREMKPSTERIRRGIVSVYPGGDLPQPWVATTGDLDWPESDQIGRRRRKTP